MNVSCDVYVAQGPTPLDPAVESGVISMPSDSESGHSLVVSQGLGAINHVPTTNKEELESNDSTSTPSPTPTPMTTMARTVPQRRCNVSHTPLQFFIH